MFYNLYAKITLFIKIFFEILPFDNFNIYSNINWIGFEFQTEHLHFWF